MIKNRIFIWAAATTLLGCLFGSFQAAGAMSGGVMIFAREIISSWIIALVSLPLLYHLLFKWIEKPYITLMSRIVGILMLVNIPVLQLQHFLVHSLLGQPVEIISLHNGFILMRGVIFLIVIGNIAIKIEQLDFFYKQQISGLKKDEAAQPHKPEFLHQRTLQIKSGGRYMDLPVDDIIFIQGDSYQQGCI